MHLQLAAATWALTIVGLGALGAMLRRQRAMQPVRVRA
jgi:hypothetical protein